MVTLSCRQCFGALYQNKCRQRTASRRANSMGRYWTLVKLLCKLLLPSFFKLANINDTKRHPSLYLRTFFDVANSTTFPSSHTMELEEIVWNGLYTAQPGKQRFAKKYIEEHFTRSLMLSHRGVVKVVVRYSMNLAFMLSR